jgi:2-dehydropantoate 2-reductase
VTLVGRWPAQIHALSTGPLRVVDCAGRETAVWVRATDRPESILPVDVALVLTKATRTEDAARVVGRVLTPDGVAISLQNGLGNDAILAGVLGPERVTAGVTTLGAHTGGQPGVVFCGGMGVTTLAARPALDARLRQVAALFHRAGLDTNLADDIAGLVWGKLAVNAAINPLTAALRVPNGDLLAWEWTRAMMARAAEEVAAVASAQAIALPFADPAAQPARVAERTARNVSSMLQDVLRGAPTEIEAINGAIVRIAQMLGVDTPVTAWLYELVKAVERTPDAHRHDD